MEFINNLSYQLGSTFEENNIDLELIIEHNDSSSAYASYRYSELYLFGKVYESICTLFFKDDKLKRIDYQFSSGQFDFIKESLISQLPDGSKFTKDPFIDREIWYAFIKDTAISLIVPNKGYFKLSVQNSPRLPYIKGSGKKIN